MKNFCDFWRDLPVLQTLVLIAGLLPGMTGAQIRVTDDTGQILVIEKPARRIVSLAPHITELLFAAGAGGHVTGVSGFSDHPPAARELPRVGSAASLDLERIIALQPDLVVAWQSGNPADQIDRLRALGVTVFMSEPRFLADIVTTLMRFGELAATRSRAQTAAAAFSSRLAGLRARYAGKPPVRVFYQVWDRPLMTIGGEHIISDVIRLCGGINVFAGMPQLAPQVGIEAVLQHDPQVIIAASSDQGSATVPGDWQRWNRMSAVRNAHLYTVPGDVLVRQTPRILDGAEAVCEILDRVREDRP